MEWVLPVIFGQFTVGIRTVKQREIFQKVTEKRDLKGNNC